MNEYRKKPVIVKAVQLVDTKDSVIECFEFIEGKEYKKFFKEHERECSVLMFNTERYGGIDIPTLEGNTKASFGDYIIEGVNGEHYACKPDIFDKNYELVIK